MAQVYERDEKFLIVGNGLNGLYVLNIYDLNDVQIINHV